MKSFKRKLERLLRKTISLALRPVKAVDPTGFNVITLRPLVETRADFSIDEAQRYIHERIESGQPFLAGRFGSVELGALRSFYFRNEPFLRRMNAYVEYGDTPWWNYKILDQLSNNAGVFPRTVETAERFCRIMLEAINGIDLLGSWLPDESLFDAALSSAKVCRLSDLEPFRSSTPWTAALAGKRVCIIHPFAKTIERQFKNRSNLFKDNRILPNFDLVTIEAVQSVANNKTPFEDWFSALDWMDKEASRIGFDVAIVGCGAYGLPLAFRIKKAGKKAIHLGGATQILFGIKGKRWDDHDVIKNLYNEYWVRPSEEERPLGAEQVEGGCYW